MKCQDKQKDKNKKERKRELRKNREGKWSRIKKNKQRE